MKKIMAVLLAVVMMLAMVACSEKKNDKHDEVITKAVEELKKAWKESYDIDEENDAVKDRYLEIKNTRVITVLTNDITEFLEVSYIVEFELFSDYLDTSPYYQNARVFNNVLVYRDGHMEVGSNVLKTYQDKVSGVDVYELVIDTIDDYQGAYNWSGKV